jgi:hypothetical protein
MHFATLRNASYTVATTPTDITVAAAAAAVVAVSIC